MLLKSEFARRSARRTTLVFATAIAFIATNSVPTISDESISISLVSPKPGTVINPDIPFVITIALTGGKAATANYCHDYSNTKILDDVTFGGQAVDVNNLGKQLGWGVPNSDYRRTDGALVGWSPRIIPNGIECSIGVIRSVPGGTGIANFSEGLDSADYLWFGTKQSSWSGNVTNFGAYSYVDLAWKYKGVITHNRFQATSLGTPEVKIVGLQRGQVINYETEFQVEGTISSSLKLDALYISVDGSAVEKFIDCDDRSKISSRVNNNGTTTYTTTCRLNFVYSTTSKTSIGVKPVIRTNIDSGSTPEGNIVSVNIGKQGQHVCLQTNDLAKQFIETSNRQLTSQSTAFAKTTTASGAMVIAANISKIISDAKIQTESLKAVELPISYCKSEQSNNLTALSILSIGAQSALAKVTKFINDPAAQKAAVKAAEEAAKKAAAEQAAFEKRLYNLGFSMISKATSYELRSLSIMNFLLPGKKYLTPSYARDWCSQLPKIVVGLGNRVGYPADPNFVSGCAVAAVKIKLR